MSHTQQPGTPTHTVLKSSLTAALMIPVIIALLAGTIIALSDLGSGAPLLAAGAVLLVFNVLLLKVLFSRLDASGPTANHEDSPEAP